MMGIVACVYMILGVGLGGAWKNLSPMGRVVYVVVFPGHAWCAWVIGQVRKTDDMVISTITLLVGLGMGACILLAIFGFIVKVGQ